MQTPNAEENHSHYCVILSTCPDQNVAESIAATLVEKKIAACVNIITGLTSVYEWQGNIEKSREFLLIVKTVNRHYQAIENAILENHPYELPEIISIPLNNGLANYLSWIDDTTASVR